MTNSEKLGGNFRGKAWGDGEPIPRVTLPDGSIAEAMVALGYCWDAGGGVFVKIPGDATNGIKVNIVAGGTGGGAMTVADGANVVEGALADAAIITNASGSISGKLRGLVKWAFERMPAALGQTTMSASLPVVISSDQSALTVGSHPVTNAGTFAVQASWAAAQHVIVDTAPSTAVTGPLTDTQLRATAVPVSGTVATGGLTDTQLRATAVPVSGAVTVTNATASNLKAAATLDAETTKVIGTVNLSAAQTLGTLSTITNVVHVDDNSGSLTVDNGGTFAVQAALAAETTKVIGVTRTADGSGNLLGSTSNALDVNIKSGNPTTIAVTNTGTFVAQATLAAETTKVIGTVNVSSGQTVGIAAGSAVIGHVIVDSGTLGSVTINGVPHVVIDSATIAALTDGTQRVGGTVTVDPSGVTSPVSLASVPLPSGAATQATLSTVNDSLAAIRSSLNEIAFNSILEAERSLFA